MKFSYQSVGSRFESPEFKENNPQCLATTFIQELKNSVPDYFTLVLEDFHEVEDSEPVIEFLNTMIPDLLESCHLVISSRSDPRLRNFRRMMVNREAFMFTQDDLKFSAEECRELLGHIPGSAVSAERAEAIAEQCDGWPGAMIMALQGSNIRPERNTGSEMFSECLAEEMLERQTDELQSFLVTTSIFQILIPKACYALLGIDNSYEILQELARKNLAIEVSTPDKATAYVYHSFCVNLLEPGSTNVSRTR